MRVLCLAILAFAFTARAADLPNGFPTPTCPPDNPMSEAKARLGRHLFYDTRLSVNGTQSCATCHRQELAFTDGRATALGATGESHTRSSMSLVNVAFAGVLTWSDPAQRSLEKQALIPMLGSRPVELGLREEPFLAMLRADPRYRDLFAQANLTFTLQDAAKAIACFERTIVSARSPYDRYYYSGDTGAISEAAKRGEVVFFTDPVAGCFRCHNGPNFTDGQYHNTGVHHAPTKFRTPSLRNIALTAPYMHDGSIATLGDVIEHYAAGGRERGNPALDSRMRPILMTGQNKRDLIAFLESLTDLEVIRDPRFANPWP